jgi:predicted nucleotidyltransferase
MKTDIQSITKSLLNRYVNLLKESFGSDLLSTAVFGSFARSKAKFPGSDIDFLIVIKGLEKLSFGERLKQTIKVEKVLSKTKEYTKFEDVFGWHPSIREIILTPEELRAHPPILLDLTTDAVIFYDTGILEEEFAKIRQRLKELGARKVKTGDSWFWILKPDLRLGEEVEL